VRRRPAPRSLSIAFERVADDVMPQTLLAEVQRVWPVVVGAGLAEVATPVAVKEGVVRVACGSAVWAQELDLMGARVVAALNEALGREAVVRLRAEARAPRFS
jgi:predicted nucleic acid-binding Zn ribbon protein